MGSDFMRSKSIRHSLMIMFLFAVLILITVISEVAIYSIRSMSALAGSSYESAVKDGYKSQIKAEVQSIITVLQAEYEKSQSGVLTENEAKREALELIREMRYGDDKKGYFWIDDTDYNLIMHPILPEQEGTNRYNLTDEQGVMIIQEIMQTVNTQDEGGYNEFHFTKEDGITVAPKIAYSQIFRPWNWVVSTGNYTDDLQLEIDNMKNKINQKRTIMMIMIVLIGLVMTIGSVIASKVFGNSICNPLIQIQNLAHRISEGNLTSDIEVKDRNELGETARALNDAQHKIAKLLSNIRDTSNILEILVEEFTNNFNRINKSIQNTSLAFEDIAGNAKSQTDSISSASENIEAIVYGVKNTSVEIESLNRNSEIMKNYSVQSMNALNELINVNKKTKYDIDLIYDQTQNTNESIIKISEAAELISEISYQTNLLSLNASIEAARAGEAGHGFIVVAEEIGKLANNSSKATKKINDIITDLMENSRSSAELAKRMSLASENQVNRLSDTKYIFGDLKKVLDSGMSSIKNIIDKMQNVNNQCDSIIKNMDILNDISKENTSSTKETFNMSADLKKALEKLSEVVKLLADDTLNLSQNMKKFKF